MVMIFFYHSVFGSFVKFLFENLQHMLNGLPPFFFFVWCTNAGCYFFFNELFQTLKFEALPWASL